jgi:hypothetical protein
MTEDTMTEDFAPLIRKFDALHLELESQGKVLSSVETKIDMHISGASSRHEERRRVTDGFDKRISDMEEIIKTVYNLWKFCEKVAAALPVLIPVFAGLTFLIVKGVKMTVRYFQS